MVVKEGMVVVVVVEERAFTRKTRAQMTGQMRGEQGNMHMGLSVLASRTGGNAMEITNLLPMFRDEGSSPSDHVSDQQPQQQSQAPLAPSQGGVCGSAITNA